MSQRSLKWQMVISACWLVLGLLWIFSGLFRDATPWAFVIGGIFLLVAAWNVVQIRKQIATESTHPESQQAPVQQAPTDQADRPI
jgi:hypothetical protein